MLRLSLLMIVLATGAAAAPAHAVLPIHQAGMANGEPRYSITIAIGSTSVEAMLDTGSSGLHVLPGVLGAADAAASDDSMSQSYSSGVDLSGVEGKARLALGDVAPPDPVRIGLVQRIACTDAKPDCPASKVSQADYRIGGGAFAGEGYKAIFGVAVRQTKVGNPLVAMGVDAWIVVLPKPGDSAPGTLILNPTPEERAGFASVRVDARGRLPGCLLYDSNRICGPVVFDSGAPGVTVLAPEKPASFPWPDGAHVTLALQPETGEAIGLGFDVRRAPGSHTRLHGEPLPKGEKSTFIRAGTLPYFAYSVLYDARGFTVGLKAR
jgi:hypothetical protein